MPLRPLLALLLLAAWLGAAVLTAAVVAPAAFAVLPTRALAGALVGRVLPALFAAGMVGGVVAALLAYGTPLPYHRGRVVLPAVVALACAAAQFGVAPRIERVRREIGPSVDALAPTDPRRVAFGRLHGLSVLMLGAAAVTAGAALTLTALALRARS